MPTATPAIAMRVTTKPLWAGMPHEMVWDALIHSSGSAVVIVDGGGAYEFANDAAAASIGLPRDQIEGRTLRDLYSPELAGLISGLFADASRRRQVTVHDGFFSGRMVRSTIYPLPETASGDGGRILSIFHPIESMERAPARVGMPSGRARRETLGSLAELSDRELRVLSLVGAGLDTQEIADRVDRSVRTVHWHCASMCRKLGVPHRQDLVRIAIGAGLVDAEAQDTAKKGADLAASGTGNTTPRSAIADEASNPAGT